MLISEMEIVIILIWSLYIAYMYQIKTQYSINNYKNYIITENNR